MKQQPYLTLCLIRRFSCLTHDMQDKWHYGAAEPDDVQTLLSALNNALTIKSTDQTAGHQASVRSAIMRHVAKIKLCAELQKSITSTTMRLQLSIRLRHATLACVDKRLSVDANSKKRQKEA